MRGAQGMMGMPALNGNPGNPGVGGEMGGKLSIVFISAAHKLFCRRLFVKGIYYTSIFPTCLHLNLQATVVTDVLVRPDPRARTDVVPSVASARPVTPAFRSVWLFDLTV